MPKIKKETLQILPRLNIHIYKYGNGKNYYCKFYIGVGHANFKSKRFERCLNTQNVNEAKKIAIQHYQNWFREKIDTKRKERDFNFDLAQPYLEYKIRKYKNKTNLKKNDQAQRDKAKWNNQLKPLFENIDYTDLELVENVINNDLLSKLKDEGKSGNTINKNMSLITQIFKRGQARGIVNFIPDTPTQQVIDTPRYPFENQELNLINNKCREEFNKTNKIFNLEAKDFYNLCRSAGFRPGLEPLSLKRKDFEYIKSQKKPDEIFLKFTVWGTKTKPKHLPISNPFFTRNIFPEILNRHHYLKDDDYLLFPYEKNRNSVYQKVSKLFVRFSKELNLFYHKGGTRPLYTLRHTYATELYKKGTSIDDIAQLMNTSPRMVLKVYLGHTDEALVNLAKRIPSKFKIIK